MDSKGTGEDMLPPLMRDFLLAPKTIGVMADQTGAEKVQNNETKLDLVASLDGAFHIR